MRFNKVRSLFAVLVLAVMATLMVGCSETTGDTTSGNSSTIISAENVSVITVIGGGDPKKYSTTLDANGVEVTEAVSISLTVAESLAVVVGVSSFDMSESE